MFYYTPLIRIIPLQAFKFFCTLSFIISSLRPVYAQNKPASLYDSAKQNLAANNYSKAIEQFTNYLPIAQKNRDTLVIGNTYIGTGIAYDRTGNYEAALQNYFTALKYYESINNIKKAAGTLKNIGNIYRVLKTYEKANGFLQQALLRFEKITDSTGASNVLNDMGILYMEQDSNYKAINYFKLVINQYQPYIKEEVKAYALNNLAYTLVRVGGYKEAFDYYFLSLQVMQKRNDLYGVALINGNLADLYLKFNEPGKSLICSKKSLEISRQLNSKELLAGAYMSMANSYTALKNYELANNFLLMHNDLKDTLFKEESAGKYAEMETKYQNEKKQKEIHLLQQENVIKNIEITNQKLTRNFLLIGLFFIIITAVILYRSYAIKRQANRELNELNDQLDEANQTKTKLLGIISHDLRTPVSSLVTLLQLQKNNPDRFTKEEKEKYDNQISESANNTLEAMEDLLVWSKSQMESFVPFKEEICLHYFFEEIIQLNSSAANAKNIVLVNGCPEDIMMQTDPNFLKVILRNLVSNAVKFTPQYGAVVLSAAQKEHTVFISVKDTGKGFEPDHLETIFEWNSIRSDSSGLGLKLAKEFTEKLNGSISVQSEVAKGTEFILNFRY